MGPKRMQPPQPGQIWFESEGNIIRIMKCPTEDDIISYDTMRGKVISVMNRIHRDRIGPKKFLEKKKDDLMVLLYPETNSSYDEDMEVELKTENLVSIETLVQNVGQVLKGKFLLCRTITPSSMIVGVDTAVEDVEGKKAMRLALFNYSMEALMGKSDFEAVLPLGTMLIVKNPVFKKSLATSNNFGLLVENPCDVELLSPKRMEALFPGVKWQSDLPHESRVLLNSPLVWEFIPDQSDFEIATKLKNVGNKAFVENRSTDAIRFYNVALEYLPEEEITPAGSRLLVDIVSNKAAALIKLGCFNPALLCTSKVLGINNGHVKGIYRHAKALLGLGKYSEVGEFLDEKLAQYPSLKEEEMGKDILKLRSIVPELGKPPGKEIIRALLAAQPPKSNKPQPPLPVGMVDSISEFRGPIQIEKSKISEGEGLFATQDLNVGTILLVSKPFAALYLNAAEKETFTLGMTARDYLTGVMANKIWLDPELGRDLYTLWAGPDLKSFTDNDDSRKITKVDVARIGKIYKCNFTGRDGGEDEDFVSCGVWIPTSKINHSCIDANAVYRHHSSGLVAMVTTFKTVKKGDEILVNYGYPLDPLEKRDFMKSYGFLCKCRLCELDRSESADVIAKRDALIKSLSYNFELNIYPFHPLNLIRDLGIIAEVERLRAATPDLNCAMTNCAIYTIAAVVLLDKRLYSECLSILEKIYAVMRNVPDLYRQPDIAAAILVCCMRMGKKKAVLKKWTEQLRQYCRLYAGTLEHVRVGYHPTIPEDLKKFGIQFFTDED